MGRTFRVFPAVLVREQVLHNNLGRTFLPFDEIQASADAWNGTPVVVRHPNGRSGRDPKVLNRTGAGWIFGARAENGSLKGEVWLELDRIRAMQDVGAMVENAEAGEIGEVSTGFGTVLVEQQGIHGGERYDVVMTRIQPDHLALLPDEVGACSVADGCGLARNAAGACNCGCGGEAMAEQQTDETVEALEATTEETPAEVSANASEGDAPAADSTASPEEVDMADHNDTARNESDTIRALRAELRDTRGRLAELEERSAHALQQEEAERVRLLEEIVANRRNPWTEEDLDEMDIAKLRKVHTSLGSDRAANYGARGGPRSAAFDSSFVRSVMGHDSVLVDKGGN